MIFKTWILGPILGEPGTVVVLQYGGRYLVGRPVPSECSGDGLDKHSCAGFRRLASQPVSTITLQRHSGH